MTYFNKKEEVIEVILTSYGKYKLSRGEWTPTYYAFFDEEIIYDSRYAGMTENSGSAEARIQEETPSMRVQTAYSDLSQQLKKLTKRTKKATTGAELGVGGQDKYATAIKSSTTRAPYMLPLGNSTTETTAQSYAPAWEISALKNEFTASSAYLSSSYENITQIPQLTIDIDYTTNIYVSTDIEGATTTSELATSELDHMAANEGTVNLPADGFLTTYFDDESLLVVEDGYLILEVNERNSAKAINQFYVEVWEVEEDDQLQPNDSQGQSLTKMSFIKWPEEIVNGVLIDPENMLKVDATQIDDTYVEYFMDIMADDEINDSAVCNYIAIDDKSRINWTRVLSCPDSGDDPGSVLYTSDDMNDTLEDIC